MVWPFTERLQNPFQVAGVIYAQKVKEAGFYMPKNWIWNIV